MANRIWQRLRPEQRTESRIYPDYGSLRRVAPIRSSQISPKR